MIKKLFFKFWPLILIFIIWFLFSSPYFIKNKVPFPSTYQVNFFSPWNSYPGFSSPVKNNATPDVITQIYPWKYFTINSLKSGLIPLWNPYSFSGTPHLANYQSAILSPFNLLFFILPFVDAWSLLVLLQPLLAGIFMFYFLKSLKISHYGSLIGAFSFMFCGFITTWIGYATLGYSILFLPLSLFSIEKYFETKKSKFLLLQSISIPLSFFSGHFQISLYFLIFIFLYQLLLFYERKNMQESFLVFLSSIFGIFLSFPQLFPSIEAYLQSYRSEIFQKTESIPWGYLSTFFAPDFLGNPVTRNDWFGHYAEWNAYVGVVPILLALIPIFFEKTKKVLFFILTAFLSILLSFDSPVLDLFVKFHIPVLSTSAVSRIIVIFSFSFAVLASIGFDKLLKLIEEKKTKPIFKWILSICCIYIFLWIVVVLKLFMPLDKIVIARQNLLLPSFILIFFVSSIFIFFKFQKTKLSLSIFSLLVILLCAFDLLRFSGKWIAFDPKNLVYPNVPVVSEFKKLAGYERFFSNLTGDATIYYKLPSIEGYDAVYIRRYGEFLASLKTGKLDESARSIVSFPKYGLNSKKALDLLNIKYVVFKIADGHSPWTFPFWTYKEGIFKLIYNDGVYQILQNTKVFPRAFLVNKYIVENNSQKILNKMFDKNFDLRKEIVLEKNPKVNLDANILTSKVENYTPNKVSVDTNANGNSFLFLSDAYYSGWRAYVDGKESEIYRADFAFRAVIVPRGKHIVTFSYEPQSFELGILGFALGILGIGVLVFRKKLF